MSATMSDLRIACLAFSYHMTALRGEVPLELSQCEVEDWFRSRPWALTKKQQLLKAWSDKEMAEEQWRDWVIKVSRYVVERLYQIGVVRDTNGKVATVPPKKD